MATNQPWSANSEKECRGERWSKPEGYPTGIFVRNSLCTIGQDATNSDIVELVTMEKNHLKFYICGPTVYALSHLGHARAYLTFDIVISSLPSNINKTTSDSLSFFSVSEVINF